MAATAVSMTEAEHRAAVAAAQAAGRKALYVTSR